MMNYSKRNLLITVLTSFVLVFLFFTLSFAQGTTIPVGNGPYSVLANPTAHEVYVANIWSDEVSVIDTLTDTLTTTIKVGPPYPGGLSAPVALAYNPNTNKLYVVNFWSAQLMAIDLSTYQVEATISVGYSSARAAVVNPNTNLIYVTNLGERVGRIYVVDGDPTSSSYNEVTKTIDLEYLSYPRSEAINTTFNRLYVADTRNNKVFVIDIDPTSPNYHQVIATISVGNEPYAIAVNHSTGKVYVANRRSNNVSVIDGATNTLTATIPTGNYPRSLDINPERNLIFVANRDSNNVTVIDGNTDTVTSTVSAGVKPYAVACIKTLTGNTYVTNHGIGTTSTVTVIDPTFSTTEEPVGIYPASLSIETLLPKSKVYVGNYGSDDVSVIDPESGSSSLVTEIDPLPGDTTSSTTPTITGTSTSFRTPYPAKIIKVYYLIDSLNEKWKEAQITEGWGTSSVKWEVKIPEPLPLGKHTIYVVALDMTGATVASTNGNISNTPNTGKVASYSFEIAPETRKMFVQEIRFSKIYLDKKEGLQIDVFIKDDGSNPVEGALVDGVLYTPRGNLLYLSELTDEEGKATFTYISEKCHLKKGVYLFAVESVEKEGYEYDPSLNQETYDYWIERPGKINSYWFLNALRKSNFK
jgi:YVTN family beta-propeller protein